MATLLASVVAALSLLLWLPPPADLDRLRRPGATRPAAGPRRRGQPPTPWPQRWRRPAVAVAVVGVGATVGGATGWLVAGAAGVALDRWSRGRPTRAERDRARRREQALPTVVDLLVACLRSGATTEQALGAVLPAVPDVLAADLHHVVAMLRRGATADEAWRSASPDLVRLARVMRRSAETGAPAADLLDALGDDLRAERRAGWLGEAQRLGVRAAAPLGLCFLPGFVALGVVPVVVGLAGRVW